ncbi:hypothetical protein V492_00365 [Pseudogymnoascus sp. VKM F-4246]|nr:hypothetical protein V492_00365 [Pseudogymnoascus sp. VKM F-4246]
MKPFDNQNYHTYTAHSRPELWKVLRDETHPLNAAWPVFLDQDTCFQRYYRQLDKYDGLAEFQYAVVKESCGYEKIVACGRSIPFYWPELDQVGGRAGLDSHHEVLNTLPDTGYDAILSRGVNQYLRRQGILSLESANSPGGSQMIKHIDDVCNRSEPPNALSAISITVDPDYRSLGIAESLIKTMKQAARRRNLQILVVPLRPTLKSDHPYTSMEEYITWSQQPVKMDIDLPFDPWLRKHVRLGGRVIKVAHRSMHVEGSLAAWQQWTQCDQWKTHASLIKLEENTNRQYIDFSFPGGLVPLRLFVQEGRCVYTEPNVWLYHEVP